MFSLKGKDFIFNEVLGVDKIQRNLIVILDFQSSKMLEIIKISSLNKRFND